jgi:hypothetical protein
MKATPKQIQENTDLFYDYENYNFQTKESIDSILELIGKKCSKCKRVLELTEFNPDLTIKGGFSKKCGKCGKCGK